MSHSDPRARDNARVAVHALLACGAEATPAWWLAVQAAPLVDRPHRPALMFEAAWARRGHLVRLRKRLRQAADAAHELAAELTALPFYQAELAAARADNALLAARLAAEARLAHQGPERPGPCAGCSGGAASGASGPSK
jgi:hypothetical protein